MEDLIKKREQELIKEGLFIIESFERYTSKNKPDIYKEYLDIIEKRKFNNNRLEWFFINRGIENIKKKFNFKDLNEDLIKEIEIYIDSLKLKFYKKEDLIEVKDVVNIINSISKLANKTKYNYIVKLRDFLIIRRFLKELIFNINLNSPKTNIS